jgi:hypothetical protein
MTNGQKVDIILVLVNYFSKISFFLPINNMINTAKLATIFYKEIECRFGPPQGIITNRGTTFTNTF